MIGFLDCSPSNGRYGHIPYTYNAYYVKGFDKCLLVDGLALIEKIPFILEPVVLLPYLWRKSRELDILKA